ncbi:tripartite tricarboxylate transporter substrate binding protein [Pusillimonas sp. TS35]|nr:tripartite tricarboxylate transporter substrate binding protein [Pusillimonas sp. TS35]
MQRRVFCVAAVVAAASITWTSAALAAYPDKPIRVVVPYPAGGAADTIARVFGERLAAIAGQPVIVENKGGASGMIGAEAVLRAEPDGYTLLLTPTTQLTNTGFNIKPSYDAVDDFAPVVGLTRAPMVLAAGKQSGITDLASLAEAGKKRPIAYGSYGAGTSTHIVLDVLSKQLGLDSTHVPYKGEAPMLNDMLGGQIDIGLYSVSVARAQAQAGKLNLLGLLGIARSQLLPQLATLQELGLRDMDWQYGVGVYTSSRVPAAQLTKLQAMSMQAVRSDEVGKRFQDLSHERWAGSPEEMQALLISDSKRWAALIQHVQAGEQK